MKLMRPPSGLLPLPAVAVALLLAAAGNAGAQEAIWQGTGEGLWTDGLSWSTGIAPGDPSATLREDVIVPGRQVPDPQTLMLQDSRIVRSVTTQSGVFGGIILLNNGGHLEVQRSDQPGSGVMTNRGFTAATNTGFTNAQTFVNEGVVVTTNAGLVGAYATDHINTAPRLFENRGFVQAIGAGVGTTGTLQNFGTMTLDGSNLDALILENSGALSLRTGSDTFIGDMRNAGTVTIDQSSALTLPGFTATGGSYVQTAGLTTLQGGALRAAGGIELLGGRLQGEGDLEGAMTVNGGTLAAGHSPGTLELDSLSLLSGVLEVEIEGTAPGEFDFYRVIGNAVLGGGPILGDTFIDFVFDSLPLTSFDLAFLRAPDIAFDPSDVVFRTFLGDQPLSLTGLYDLSVEMRPTRLGDFMVLSLDRLPASLPTPAPVPAPPTLALLGVGLFCLALRRRPAG
jgi:hypothetical protein